MSGITAVRTMENASRRSVRPRIAMASFLPPLAPKRQYEPQRIPALAQRIGRCSGPNGRIGGDGRNEGALGRGDDHVSHGERLQPRTPRSFFLELAKNAELGKTSERHGPDDVFGRGERVPVVAAKVARQVRKARPQIVG